MNKIKQWTKAQNVDPKIALKIFLGGMLLGAAGALNYFMFVK